MVDHNPVEIFLLVNYFFDAAHTGSRISLRLEKVDHFQQLLPDQLGAIQCYLITMFTMTPSTYVAGLCKLTKLAITESIFMEVVKHVELWI